VERCYHPKDDVNIAIVGKYVEYEDSYKSLKEALTHGAVSQNLKLNVTWIEAEGLESKTPEDTSYEGQLAGFDGILVPGGFGKRGIEGMLNAIRYAREKQVPYFGICLGMQTACIEFARNVCGLKDANSSEFDPASQHRIIYKLRELLAWKRWVGPCGWVRGPASCRKIRWRRRPTAEPRRSASGTGTAMSSTANTKPCLPRRTAHQRHDARRDLCGDRRDSRAPLLPWLPVSSEFSRSRWSRIRSSGSLYGELQDPAGKAGRGSKDETVATAMRQ